MNEMTEAGGKAKGGRGKGGRVKGGKAEDATVEGQIGRMLVRVIWAQEWSAANPEAKADERKAAWKDARNDAMDKNLKAYRRALTHRFCPPLLTRTAVSGPSSGRRSASSRAASAA